ncbi:MAG: hypothetical protein J6V63_05650 [Spirochaetaceae bacterium]|nr:hypothetical protein [Spirochaetaceae bacterium]
MKKFVFFFTSLVLVCLMMSCEFFSKPLYRFSRDISGVIGSMSTDDLAGNVDKMSSDPKIVADVLNELAGRNQDEINDLSKDDKEKLLNAGVSAILPVSQLGDMVEQLTKGDESMDFATIMDSLTQGAPAINTKALETILEDENILKTTDASTLAFSAASLIVNTVKTEVGDSSSFEDKMKDFQAAAKAASNGGAFNAETFKNQLGDSFTEESKAALTAAMGVADVLTGDRKDEAAGVGIGGFTISDLLDKMKGGQ